VGYFRRLMAINTEIDDSIRPLLTLGRETIERCQRTEYALVSSLERDPLLQERIRRLRTVPGVGPITALNWALEMGDISRFRSIKQAVSYCGLCGDERSSADKVMRTPISKQRNKHIQHVLVEAAKLAPRLRPGAGAGPSEGDGEEQQQESGDAGRGSQDGGLAAGGGSGEPRVHPGRAADYRGRIKTG
jgi:transposase